ncbi:MAG: hypothetical protein PHH51_01595 [Bacilli bacterium]|nr:hypothetical protein [Bacilli bacterium]MDD3895639.1 hypothetical protein [Bacilli bacterium]MDD4407698.1 hypothetical protein [Bacilli bacterium]
MKKNKLIINYCPNFYKIINFDFFEDDYISKKLVAIYKDFIFDIDLYNEDDIYMIKQMDLVVNKYIEDYYFRKEMQRSMLNIRVKKSSQLVRDIAQSIINCFDSYENGYTRNIYFARWI